MLIEILYFEGGPHFAETVDLTRAAAAECGLDAEVRLIPVSTEAEAVHQKFPGSPSVRVNGTDIEPDARGRTAFVLSCRLYGSSGVPSKALLLDALREVG